MWIGAYTRRSRDEQNDPTLLDNHKAILLRLAAQDGITLTPERLYTEIGSGESIEGRPVFRRLLEEWEQLPAGSGGVLYLTELSRLSRDSDEGGPRIGRALQRAGIEVRTTERRFDLKDIGDHFMFRLLGLLDHQEQSRIKQRMEAGRREKRRKGEIPNGVPPLGYRYSIETGTLYPDPERFPVLLECVKRAPAEPVWKLALEYDVPETSLLRALRNPTICGYPARRYGPKDPENPHRKSYVPIPREQWLWPEQQNTSYPHACTREEWETLQAALDLRREQRPRSHQGEGWCRDRVQFSSDPGPVRLGSYAVTRTPTGNVMCLTYERSRRRAAPHLFLPRQIVHDAVLAALTGFFTHPKVLPRLKELARRQEDREPVSADVERASLTRTLADLRRRYQETVDAEMDAETPDHYHALRERRRRLQDRLDRLQRQLQDLEARGEERQVAQLFADLPLDIAAEDFLGVWGETDGFQKRLYVNALFRVIEVTIEPTEPPRPHRREVSRIEWQSWVPELTSS
jgi:DNA invertase Pin-like site-specific DNA recombinase